MSERLSLAIVLKCLGRFAASLFLIGFATTCLLRLAPGFGVDEREIDLRFSNAAIEQLKKNVEGGNVFVDYGRFLHEGARGEFGFSKSLNRPVRELIQQRYPTSVRILLLGLAAGWLCAFLLAAAAAVLQSRVVSFAGHIEWRCHSMSAVGLDCLSLLSRPCTSIPGCRIRDLCTGVPRDRQLVPQCSAGNSCAGCKSKRRQ